MRRDWLFCLGNGWLLGRKHLSMKSKLADRLLLINLRVWLMGNYWRGFFIFLDFRKYLDWDNLVVYWKMRWIQITSLYIFGCFLYWIKMLMVCWLLKIYFNLGRNLMKLHTLKNKYIKLLDTLNIYRIIFNQRNKDKVKPQPIKCWSLITISSFKNWRKCWSKQLKKLSMWIVSKILAIIKLYFLWNMIHFKDSNKVKFKTMN